MLNINNNDNGDKPTQSPEYENYKREVKKHEYIKIPYELIEANITPKLKYIFISMACECDPAYGWQFFMSKEEFCGKYRDINISDIHNQIRMLEKAGFLKVYESAIKRKFKPAHSCKLIMNDERFLIFPKCYFLNPEKIGGWKRLIAIIHFMRYDWLMSGDKIYQFSKKAGISHHTSKKWFNSCSELSCGGFDYSFFIDGYLKKIP